MSILEFNFCVPLTTQWNNFRIVKNQESFIKLINISVIDYIAFMSADKSIGFIKTLQTIKRTLNVILLSADAMEDNIMLKRLKINDVSEPDFVLFTIAGESEIHPVL